jgi:hypothetical protein
MKAEVIIIKCSTDQLSDPLYVITEKRADVEKSLKHLSLTYPDATLEVMECTVNHCTKAQIVVNW